MKKYLLPLLFAGLLLSACNQTAAPTGGEPSGGGEPGGGGETTPKTSATVDFTVTHDRVDDIPSAADTANQTKFFNMLTKYYFTNTNIALSSVTGEYMNVNSGFDVTKTRYYPQMAMLGSRKKEVDLTFNFVNTIKTVTFVCEAYCKYVNHGSTYYVDYPTYLTVNGEKKDIATHSASDVNETQNLKYTVNSKQIKLECPNTNQGEDDTTANRIIVYQMIFEF